MTARTGQGNAKWFGMGVAKPRALVLAFGLALVSGTGCGTVPVNEQRLVSKPNMLFGDSTVFSYYSQVLPQLETGAAISGGAQATTCSACR